MSYFTFEDLQKRVIPEFGMRYEAESYVFPEGDHFVFSYDGRRIAEQHINGRFKLITADYISSGHRTRWANILGVNLLLKKRQKANGQYCMDFTIYNNRANLAVAKQLVGDIWVDTINWTITQDKEAPKLIKDNKKYTAFNKKLKLVKSILFTQLRMGTYTKLKAAWDTNRRMAMERLILAHTGENEKRYWWRHREDVEIAHHIITAWDGKDNTAKPLSDLLYCTSRSWRGLPEEKHLTGLLRSVQREHLRAECVTIVAPIVSNESSADDQDNVVFPPAGLREVQVPCEVEVC